MQPQRPSLHGPVEHTPQKGTRGCPQVSMTSSSPQLNFAR